MALAISKGRRAIGVSGLLVTSFRFGFSTPIRNSLRLTRSPSYLFCWGSAELNHGTTYGARDLTWRFGKIIETCKFGSWSSWKWACEVGQPPNAGFPCGRGPCGFPFAKLNSVCSENHRMKWPYLAEAFAKRRQMT